MTPRLLSRRTAIAVAASVGVLAAASCNSSSAGHAAVPTRTVVSAVTSHSVTAAPGRHHHHRSGQSRHALLHPARKYYGVSLSGAPNSLTTYHQVAQQVHKAPQLVGFFLDWTHLFPLAGAQRVCRVGATPSVTWESWSWEDRKHGHSAFTQPAYAPRRIAHGFRGAYVRQFAEQIRKVHCPVMLRFDQEMNGFWYPWGLRTKGMHNKPASYVAMWRHVWRVFHALHVNNVVWVWSPNFVHAAGKNLMRPAYPGNKYVDMVGIDGYLYYPGDTPHSVFGPTLQKLRGFAPNEPVMIAETGAPDDAHQPARIRSLLRAVAANKRLVAFSYLDESGSRANWAFSGRPASVAAFRQGIGRPVYRGAHR